VGKLPARPVQQVAAVSGECARQLHPQPDAVRNQAGERVMMKGEAG